MDKTDQENVMELAKSIHKSILRNSMKMNAMDVDFMNITPKSTTEQENGIRESTRRLGNPIKEEQPLQLDDIDEEG